MSLLPNGGLKTKGRNIRGVPPPRHHAIETATAPATHAASPSTNCPVSWVGTGCSRAPDSHADTASSTPPPIANHFHRSSRTRRLWAWRWRGEATRPAWARHAAAAEARPPSGCITVTCVERRTRYLLLATAIVAFAVSAVAAIVHYSSPAQDRPAVVASSTPVSGLATVAVGELPSQARDTLVLIDKGGPYP